MGIDLTQHEVHACRAVARLVAVKTEGWAEAEYADAHWDAGEWSGPAWADNWQRADEEATKTVAERFGLERRSPNSAYRGPACGLVSRESR